MSATLRSRFLRLLEPESGGPRKLTVLAGLAGSAKRALEVLRPLIRERLVKVTRYGNRGGSHYSLSTPRAKPHIRPLSQGGRNRRALRKRVPIPADAVQAMAARERRARRRSSGISHLELTLWTAGAALAAVGVWSLAGWYIDWAALDITR